MSVLMRLAVFMSLTAYQHYSNNLEQQNDTKCKNDGLTVSNSPDLFIKKAFRFRSKIPDAQHCMAMALPT